MFDVGFSELMLTALVALLVIGPERLPKVARTLGLWTGRARRFVNQVKADIEQEMKAEELKRVMEEQAKSSGIHEIIEGTRETLEDAKHSDYLVKAEPPQTTPPTQPADKLPETAGTANLDDKQSTS